MIESLIEILKQTPADSLCSVAGCTHHTDCLLCPFINDYKKEVLIGNLKDLLK